MGPPFPRVRGGQDQLASRVGPRPLLGALAMEAAHGLQEAQ